MFYVYPFYFFQKSYFPTMPQDDLDLITEALLANRPDDGSENPVFHSNYYNNSSYSNSFCKICILD